MFVFTPTAQTFKHNSCHLNQRPSAKNLTPKARGKYVHLHLNSFYEGLHGPFGPRTCPGLRHAVKQARFAAVGPPHRSVGAWSSE